MKICAVICEYNPFHTGHHYQLSQARNQFDEVVCLMSGNFVQRAEPAIAEKSVRARIALSGGASMVAEIPIIYATSGGETFAYGAIKTLKEFSDIDALVMGCETEDIGTLRKIADIQSQEDELFKESLAQSLSKGMTYAAAITTATAVRAQKENITEEKVRDILIKPNNLLCIEYIKAINKFSLKIQPVFIKRKGNDYNSISTTGNYISATSLRNLMKNGDFTAATAYLTNEYEELFSEYTRHAPDEKVFSDIVSFALRASDTADIAKAFDCREGMEFRLKESAMKFTNLTDILDDAKTKRYTMARLKRIALQVVLGIYKELLTGEPYIPPRLLAIKETFKPYLTENGAKMLIRNDDFTRYSDEYFDRYFAVERRAAALYSAVTHNPADLFAAGKLYSI